MKTPVIIKGSNKGLRLIISDNVSFEQIICYLRKKTINYQKQEKCKPFSVTFEGKNLTDDEKKCILQVLRLDKIKKDVYFETPKKQFDKNQIKNNKLPEDNCGLFFFGDIKNGQILEAKESIIIVGNVQKGAKVYSQGNIVVIGRQKGLVKSGCKGKTDTFVYALM